MKLKSIHGILTILLLSSCSQQETLKQSNSNMRFDKNEIEKHEIKAQQYLNGKVKSIKEIGHDFTNEGEQKKVTKVTRL